MSFGDDEEILQDFLVEAGEILELLSEQLVDLENSPEDTDLLNAIFRGFHTVKGGAGFLQIDAMVECCHVTENLFDILRNGKRSVSPALMDVVLQALDMVNQQFAELSAGETPSEASPELLEELGKLATPEGEGEAEAPAEPEPVAEEAPAPAAEASAEAGGDEITQEEFDALLDELDGSKSEAQASGKVDDIINSDNPEITDAEFEALLDGLHGAAPKAEAPAAKPAAEAPKAAAGGGDEISEAEFDALLDDLHGKGQGPTAAAEKPAEDSKVSKIEPAKAKAAPKKAEPKKEAAKPAAKANVTNIANAKKGSAGQGAAASGEASVRVDTQRLDEIMNMVGELVLVRNRLVRIGGKSSDESLSKAVANLDVVTADLQSSVMKTRMQPIKKVFGRFPRVVRDLARNLGKEIKLELVGEDTDLDKNLVEALADPLVHLVRNAVDHGIESPDKREASGKSRVGTVTLAAEQEGDHILLSITDDGGGMDPDALRKKAVEKGLYDEDSAARLTDEEAFNLIFAPGFSTKVEISDVSGRGVGMDVVKTKISQLNGSVDIKSRLGEGTSLVIKVPLTLAIMPTLMVMLGDQTFALPLMSVNEIFQMDLTKTNIVDAQECVTIRDKAVPLFYLKKWLVEDEIDPLAEAHVVIVSVGTDRVGFVVDRLIGQEEVVIKPLGQMLQGTPGMAGATITGDGTMALILDVPAMLKRYA
ncbi:chemotaxis protein CheA [Pseudoteredinibacter isoporae]|uniref:Chemotaxis protein CheA n=1 Tax=Pseudoteredinibacter isoporae TaxID=570281 RepID=A0A7X0JWC4_9GAMM|nr:chemotaxis protein CheA [Pseudoteredinibacter isoporae]MBB6523452.1 two-component system chemotaxis sensor kinase CheA [Pseudoteredinibacter isoporae]NHO88961.1 chemotaxis protein CheA [Pseudoteredinibacter isoporae]NIB24331.1 chemotaxis protein CheA [Pseudoteredinibacter isoporae]